MTNEGNDSASYQANWYNLRVELLDNRVESCLIHSVLREVKYSGELKRISRYNLFMLSKTF